MYYLVQEAWRRGYVRKVIAVSKSRCQYEFDLGLVEALPGEARLISGLGQIKDKVWAGFPSRWLGELIFDRYAASRLTRPGGILVTTPRLLWTTQKAKALDYKTLLYGGHAHPEYLLAQIQVEQDTFGLRNKRQDPSRAWQMARFAAHVKHSDYIIAVSEFAKDTYVQHGFPSARIFVAPLGVDLKKFRTTLAPVDDSFIGLFVAHVDGSTGILKGLPYLLQAWTELNLHNAKLFVCGNIGHEMQELIRGYDGKLNTVEFTGPVKNPATYYEKASVFVFPSIAEGLPKVVLEAMASGRPVITTSVLKPVIREGMDGFYIAPRDTEALKAHILYFYQHREELRQMGANASEQARRFTWERFSAQVADIVEEVTTA